MKRSKRIGGPILSLIILAAGSHAWGDPTTQPSVASVLSGMDSAYAKLQSAEFDGHIVGHFDAAGQIKNDDLPFKSSFAAPNMFRHEMPSQILMGSTGTTVYSYLNSREEYQSFDAPKTRAASADWPASVTRILEDQNPSLLLAMSKSASAELNEFSKKITLETPTVLDGISYDTLRFDVGTDHEIVTMLVDPVTHLLHEVKFDLRKPLEKAGVADVKTAEETITYSSSVPDAPVTNTQFAWAAPAGATLASVTNALAATDDGLSDDLKGLVGKEAPDFTLNGLDDKPVKLSDQKGSVVIVDFWATWCGPCVQSLPHLDKLYKENSSKGLKAFAVDLQEEKEKVKTFVEKKGWTLPVLLDSGGATAAAYKADAIPETVVIGKDGKIKQIFVGGGHEEAIAALVEQEMK
jgi:peroxiredoxin/outer membrane lipoprotein-sorting protein